ncbi:MAG: hypothetical protein AAGF15_10755 [Pseudomonadota bacterium]
MKASKRLQASISGASMGCEQRFFVDVEAKTGAVCSVFCDDNVFNFGGIRGTGAYQHRTCLARPDAVAFMMKNIKMMGLNVE